MNVIPARAVCASPTHDQGFAMNLREKSTSEEFERALAQCRPEDFDGHTEFYRLTPEQRLDGCVRQQPSFTSSKVRRILTLGIDSGHPHLNPLNAPPGRDPKERRKAVADAARIE